MHQRWAITIFCLLVSLEALARPFHTDRSQGGPLAGPAWSNTASIGLNPAAMPAQSGPAFILEGSFLQERFSIQTTRNGGIDPNSLEEEIPYAKSSSVQWSPGGYAGLVWPLLSERLVLGLAIQTPWQTQMDFREDPESSGLNVPARYGAIAFTSSSLQFLPAIAVRAIKGVHVGSSLGLSQDKMSLLQTLDPLGSEGLGPGPDSPGFYVPYSNDVRSEGQMTGWHLEGTFGIWVDRIPFVQLGASYTHRAPMRIEGTGSLEFPELMGGVTVPTRVGLTMNLAPELRIGLATQPDLPVQASISWGMEFWGTCCGDREGDGTTTVLDENGNIIGPDHGVIVEIAEEVYLPRRLENSMNLRAGMEYRILPIWSMGAHAGLRTRSVPDFAVNALNQDFDTRELGLHTGIQIGDSARLGLSYTQHFSTPRSVTNSAWDVRIISASDVSEDYVDERFSPQLPYTASGNGDYSHSSQILAMRLEFQL